MTSRDHEPLTPDERALSARLVGGDAPSPPASLDASILAASRAAIAPGAAVTAPMEATAAPTPQTPSNRIAPRRRWPFGVGIAASLLVAVGVAWQLRPLPETAERTWSEMPATSSQPSPAAPAPVAASASPAITNEDAAPTPFAAADMTPAAEAADAADTVEIVEAPVPVETRPVPDVSPAAVNAEPPAAEAAREPLRALSGTDVTDRSAHTEPPQAERTAGAMTSAQSVPLPPSQKTAIGNQVVTAPVVRPAPSPAPPAPAAASAPAPPAATRRAADLRASEAPAASQQRQSAELEKMQESAPSRRMRDSAVVEGDDDEPPASADSPEVRKAWLARIRELVADGQIEAARASLVEFHRRHPQAALPDDLRPLIE